MENYMSISRPLFRYLRVDKCHILANVLTYQVARDSGIWSPVTAVTQHPSWTTEYWPLSHLYRNCCEVTWYQSHGAYKTCYQSQGVYIAFLQTRLIQNPITISMLISRHNIPPLTVIRYQRVRECFWGHNKYHCRMQKDVYNRWVNMPRDQTN